jgi:hypothetical protein
MKYMYSLRCHLIQRARFKGSILPSQRPSAIKNNLLQGLYLSYHSYTHETALDNNHWTTATGQQQETVSLCVLRFLEIPSPSLTYILLSHSVLEGKGREERQTGR